MANANDNKSYENANAPSEWVDYEAFAPGIDTLRVSQVEDLVGQPLKFTLETGEVFELQFTAKNQANWSDGKTTGKNEWCEALLIDPNIYFVDMTFEQKPRDARSILFNTVSKQVLVIDSHIVEERVPGESMAQQNFINGVLGNGPAAGETPHESRDLIGFRQWVRYSDNHVYEHTFLSSKRYCWQNLKGVQFGLGDVDYCTTVKFENDIYVMAFREFIIPVCSVFILNYRQWTNNGKFLALNKEATRVTNDPAGGIIIPASRTYYPRGDFEPI